MDGEKHLELGEDEERGGEGGGHHQGHQGEANGLKILKIPKKTERALSMIVANERLVQNSGKC